MPPTMNLGKAFVTVSAHALTAPQSPRSLPCAMSERPRKPPRLSEPGRAGRETRRLRLAEALRDNLRKRKAQARARVAAEAPADGRDGEPNGEPASGQDGEPGGEPNGQPGGEA